jgi:hypothetical protein
VDIEALGLEAGKAVRNDLESGTHGVEMIEAFLQTKVAQIGIVGVIAVLDRYRTIHIPVVAVSD